jgi:predicted XRE-type DNA-binding protein
MKIVISKEETRRNIALSVARLMSENDLTQHALAEATEVDQPRISLMLKQRILVNPCDLANIAEALGVDVSELIYNRRLAKA